MGLIRQLSLRLPGVRFKSLEPSEAQIERLICDYLFSKRIFFYKQPNAGFFDMQKKVFRKHQNPFVRRGTPDLILVRNGQYIGLEVKSKKGRQSDAQIVFQKDVERAGGLYYLVRSLEDVENLLRGI